MDELKLIRQPSLADQVLRILIDRIKDGVYPPNSQLPPEKEIIEEFNVSRATLRSAYAKLEENRLIQRRQGIGTFVSKQLSIANPLYQMIDFDDRIAMQGFKTGFKQLSARIVVTESEIAGKLEVDTDSQSLRIEKIWTADDEPIIYIVNHIPLWVFESHFSQKEILKPGLTEPFFQFFSKVCNTPIDHLTSCITPEIVENCDLPDEFSTRGLNTPVLMIDDVGFTSEGRPVFHSIEHLFGVASKFETIRRIL
jgi:GntR family transcriptional regulator